jgi:hypothetical protein
LGNGALHDSIARLHRVEDRADFSGCTRIGQGVALAACWRPAFNENSFAQFKTRIIFGSGHDRHGSHRNGYRQKCRP